MKSKVMKSLKKHGLTDAEKIRYIVDWWMNTTFIKQKMKEVKKRGCK